MQNAFPNAVAHFQAGRYAECIAVCRALLAVAPRHHDAWHLYGLALSRSDLAAEGAEAIEKSLAIEPRQSPACCNLGEIYRKLGRLADAERVLRDALRMQPRFAEAAYNLGIVFKEQDRYAEAAASYQQALEWRPDLAKAHLNLANTLRAEGRLPRSIHHYREYLRLQPPRSDILLSLGGAHGELGEQDAALACFRQAHALDPESEDVETAIANALCAHGMVAEAAPFFARRSDRRPCCLLRRLRRDLLCEVIPPDAASIDAQRSRVLERLKALRDERLTVDVAQLHASGAEPPMPLCYHGRDDQPLKEASAALFAEAIRPLELPRRTGRPRVGIVVTSGHEGVYSECLGRLVARLSRSELDVAVVCSRSGMNILRHLMPDANVQYVRIPDRVDEAAATLRDAAFDLLHYWEIGTDSLNYFLPFYRPAPVQSGCWGWPVTSGQPHVQYFVSSRLIEPDGAAAHYTEQLAALETLPTWYRRPPVPARLGDRSQFGLPVDGHVYLCTQNLRKCQPDFDSILGDILRRDPAATIYVIEDTQPAITRLLRQRFDRQLPDVAERIVFVPRRERLAYLNLVALADVMLDTLHYGGGANSLYDAFACGTPVVTLPGAFHRGRYAYGAYRRLEIPDLIADSPQRYAELAVRVASDADFRDDLQGRLRARSEMLFEDDQAVREHEAFFLEAIARSRADGNA